MSLEQKINQDLKEAMKAKDQIALRSIRAIKSAILLAKTDGSGTEINEEKEIQMLQKLVKQRKDSIEIFDKQGRDDLAKTEREEVAIIQKYLPEQMDAAAIEAAVKSIIAETGASSMKDMGRVMGMASKQLAGKAEGKAIADMVKQILAG